METDNIFYAEYPIRIRHVLHRLGITSKHEVIDILNQDWNFFSRMENFGATSDKWLKKELGLSKAMGYEEQAIRYLQAKGYIVTKPE